MSTDPNPIRVYLTARRTLDFEHVVEGRCIRVGGEEASDSVRVGGLER